MKKPEVNSSICPLLMLRLFIMALPFFVQIYVLYNKELPIQQIWSLFSTGQISMRIQENSQAPGTKNFGMTMRSELVWGDVIIMLHESFG